MKKIIFVMMTLLISTSLIFSGENDGVDLLDFGATWCIPCRKMDPIIDSISKDFKVLKIDIDKNVDLMKKYNVTKVPTMIVLKDGKVYEAERPECFFKSSFHRVVGTNDFVRIRKDSTWDVPEPELTLSDFQSLRSRSDSSVGVGQTLTGSRCQISLAYSAMVRSLENLPMRAALRMAIFAHMALSRKAVSTFFWASL